MMNENPLLLVEKVTKVYTTPDGSMDHSVFQDLSLEIAKGESLAIVGPSGSGKSTLLNLMGGLDRPTAGRVILSGQDLALLPERELAQVRNRQIGFVFQLHHLLPQCTALENVLIPTLPYLESHRRQSGAERQPLEEQTRERANYLLERVGLGSRGHFFPGQLSGGERQRTAVVRALINNPQILLADEPTGSLDHRSALDLVRLLVGLNREDKITLVMVTHSPELAGMMGRTLWLEDGKWRDLNR